MADMLPCPVGEACEGCGAGAGLAVYEADTRVGVVCFVLCPDCRDHRRTPRLGAPGAVLRVLAHCEHTGSYVDEPAGNHHDGEVKR